MKFNWGTGIFIFLIIFFISIFWFVYFSFQTQEELVEDDYYPKEIAFEEQVIKQKNLKVLGKKIEIERKDNNIILCFPRNQTYNKVKGHIIIYRPSNSKLDQLIPIKLDSLGKQLLNTSKFLNGKYIIKVEWTYHQQSFYQELSLIY